MPSKETWKFLGLAVLVALILYLRNFKYYETDYLWIVKGGEWIWKNHRIPHQDIWSYTLPNYHWIFHEWGSGVLMYLISTKLGYWALSLLGCLMIMVAILINSPKKLVLRYYVVYLITAVILTASLSGFRPQAFSLFFSALYLSIYLRYFRKPQLVYLIILPILMVFWVNLHGGFFMGLLIALYAVAIKLVQSKYGLNQFVFLSKPTRKELGLLIGTFLAVFLATLINPYGVQIYGEVFRTLLAPGVPISEWMPTQSYLVMAIIALFFSLTVINFKKLPLEAILICYFAMFSMFVQKFVPTFILFSLYPFCLSLQELSKTFKSQSWFAHTNRAKPWLIYLFAVILVALLQSEYKPLFRQPDNALVYLKAHPGIGQRMFNNYGFGGYLIANYPEQKVFIDGRMASWKDQSGYLAKEYTAVTTGRKPYQSLFEKYGVDWLILRQESDQKLISLLNKDKNWQIVYQDDVAVIYQKTQSLP